MKAFLDPPGFPIGCRINVIQSRSALLSNRIGIYLALGESY